MAQNIILRFDYHWICFHSFIDFDLPRLIDFKYPHFIITNDSINSNSGLIVFILLVTDH